MDTIKYGFMVHYHGDLRPIPEVGSLLEVSEVRRNVPLEEGEKPIGAYVMCTPIDGFEWREKYIELQRNLLDELKKRASNGWTMAELQALRRLEEVEDSLS